MSTHTEPPNVTPHNDTGPMHPLRAQLAGILPGVAPERLDAALATIATTLRTEATLRHPRGADINTDTHGRALGMVEAAELLEAARSHQQPTEGDPQ